MSAATADDNEHFERNQAAGANWDGPDATDELERLPVLTLIQNTGPLASETKASGAWYVAGFDPLPMVRIIPYKSAWSRRWSTNEGAGQETHCYSPAGFGFGVPTDERGAPFGGTACAECPNAAWGPNRTPPACTLQLRFRAVLVEAMMPVQVVFQSSSMPIGKMMGGIVKAMGRGNALFRLTSKEVTENKQTWWLPVPKVIPGPYDGWEDAAFAFVRTLDGSIVGRPILPGMARTLAEQERGGAPF